jgi:hypothetical protein
VAFAWVEIEQFIWAPQGFPHLVPDAKVYPLSLSVAENNGAPAQRIPYIQAGPAMGQFYQEALTEEEFYELQQAIVQANEYRAKWAAQIPENQALVTEKQASVIAEVAISIEAPAALLSDGIEEGSFDAIDD